MEIGRVEGRKGIKCGGKMVVRDDVKKEEVDERERQR